MASNKKNILTDGAISQLIKRIKGEIDTYLNKYHRKFTVVIPEDSWAIDETGYYYSTVTAQSILDADIPEMSCNVEGVESTAITDYLKAYNFIIQCDSLSGGLKFKAYDKPTVDLTIDILGLTPPSEAYQVMGISDDVSVQSLKNHNLNISENTGISLIGLMDGLQEDISSN